MKKVIRLPKAIFENSETAAETVNDYYFQKRLQ